MKKGIIMEIDDAFLTLLTPEGEFFRTRRQDHPYSIGEEIHFFPIESKKSAKSLDSLKNLFSLKTVWVVMAALFIFLGSFIPLYQNNNAYAYMSIDANPSIELGVNKKMQVVELTGFNKEGKKIISNLNDWKKKDVSKLTKSILVEMKNAGFITNNEQVIISTVRTKQPEEKAEKDLQMNMSKIKDAVNNQQLNLTLLTATESDREKAHELGISTGKYQEKKNQSSQKKKLKSIEKEQKQNSLSSEDDKVIPPGQLKKQLENSADQNSGLTENPVNETNRSEETSIPPGQLKEADEEQWKQNQGQSKKQVQQQENTYQPNKWDQKQQEKQNEKLEKQNEKLEKQNEKQKEKQKEKQNDSNQNNQGNQKGHKNK
ncbi:anti-sigma factor domain-containing protein [Neobacillus sp. WH10]|uniref:anti-sigma factor domain-containing protein n=1 Tax=Neobacillus sp. WH10 TaxID=3047873 RepID=UPI0024C14D6F|nr:anti-sigma factor domain-containing protein [Neobacillus sp. WH10]WHY79115.1 anti-sigma factor domain-containing protein [Neobacillus sp. WH10]